MFRHRNTKLFNECPTDCEHQLPCLTYADTLLPRNSGVCRIDSLLESMHSKAFAETVSELTACSNTQQARRACFLDIVLYSSTELHCQFAHSSGLAVQSNTIQKAGGLYNMQQNITGCSQAKTVHNLQPVYMSTKLSGSLFIPPQLDQHCICKVNDPTYTKAHYAVPSLETCSLPT